jgi:large subunit ribosomal protein L17
LGKRGSLADRRLLLSRIPSQAAVAKIFSELAPRFKDRNGGYPRIFKMDRRPGDNAEMALIEFLDAQLKKPDAETTKKAKKAEKKLAASSESKAAKAKARDDKKAAKSAKVAKSAKSDSSAERPAAKSKSSGSKAAKKK